VTYGNGLFVAVASTGTDRVMTSPDAAWFGVTFGNGVFVAVDNADGPSGNQAMSSTDGIDWTLDETPNYASATGWQAVTYGDGRFVAVAATGTDRVMTSP